MNAFVVFPTMETHPRANDVIGKRWLRQRVEAAINAMKGKQNLSPSTIGQTFGRLEHQLISETYRVVNGDRRATQNIISTPLLDSLEIDLNDLADVPKPNDLRNRLRDGHDFEKVAYELRIAAGFRRLGHWPCWVPPMHQPHPEFLVLSTKSQIISVECKKRDARDGYQNEGKRFWEHFQYQLRHSMAADSLNYWVKISGREFRIADVDGLVREIVPQIKTEIQGQFYSGNGRYQIEYMKLTEPGESIPMEIVNLFPKEHFGINGGTQRANQIMIGPLQDPKLLRLEILDDPAHRIKGLLRNLKSAARQIPSGLQNLVYIDINIDDYEQEQVEFDEMAEAIQKQLYEAHKKVSAVVLTNIYPALSLDEKLGWRVRTMLIRHSKPSVKLSNSLSFPGDEVGSHWLRGTWDELR